MKIFFTLLVVIFILKNISYSQTYFPFPESNAIWQVGFGGESCYCCKLYQYYFNSDTVINTISYKKIFKSGIQYLPPLYNGFCENNTIMGTFNYYSCAIRADNILKKVYIVPKDSATEFLLYDFNLNIGDTLKSWLNYANYSTSFASDTIIISNIDSVLVGDNYRKRWNIIDINPFVVGMPIQIIEGIGSTGGPFYEPLFVFETGGWLECFQQSNQTLYPDTNTNCVINQVNEIKKEDNFQFFPNPTSSKVFLSYDGDLKNNVKIKLINLFGDEIFMKQENILYNNYTIDLANLPCGIYLLEIIEDNRVIINKVFKN